MPPLVDTEELFPSLFSPGPGHDSRLEDQRNMLYPPTAPANGQHCSADLAASGLELETRGRLALPAPHPAQGREGEAGAGPDRQQGDEGRAAETDGETLAGWVPGYVLDKTTAAEIENKNK